MDSATGTNAVRTAGLGSGWTRLYESTHFVLDLSLQPNQSEATLVGHILPNSPEHEVVGSVATPTQRYIPLDVSGGFRAVHPGPNVLHIHLGSGLIVVRGLEA